MPTLTLSARAERPAIASTGQQRLLVAVDVSASSGPLERARPPISCVLALDVSGSMAGPPLEQVVRSVDRLTELVAPTDRLGIVAFSDGATVASELVDGDDAGRRVLQRRAHRLVADGWTNVEEGLRTAAGLLASEAPDRRRSVVLLSDGVPNRGASTPEALRAVVGGVRPVASVSTLGYGTQHNEDVLAAVADAGGGRYQFIQDPALARHELALALGAQADVVASGVELGVQPARGVELVRVVGFAQPRFREGGAVVGLPDLEANARRLVVVELEVLSAPRGGELAAVSVAWRDARTGAAEEARAAVVVDVRDRPAELDPAVHARVLLGRCEEERARARALADRGQFEGAAAALRAFLREVEASPAWKPDDGSELWEAHELVLDEAMALERRPSQEAYQVFRKQTLVVRADYQTPSMSSLRVGRSVTSLTRDKPAGPIPKAALVMLDGPTPGARFPVGERCTIGRTSAAEIVVASPSVSRRHADVFALEGEHWVCDLGSTNPTLVNGAPLGAAPHKLAPGDVIQVGVARLRYELLS